jgi:Alpha/beta hydrolase domain
VAGNKTVFRGGKRMNRIASALVAATVLLAASIAPAAAEVVRPFSEARIAELYKNRDDYVNQIRVAARKLEAEKLLLPEDAAVIVAAAAMHWPPVEKKK